jgi:hypothetical protein
MSDAPLFQGSDEQEAAYAPSQLPDDDPRARRPTDALDADRLGPAGGSPESGLGGPAGEAAEDASGQTPSG